VLKPKENQTVKS